VMSGLIGGDMGVGELGEEAQSPVKYDFWVW